MSILASLTDDLHARPEPFIKRPSMSFIYSMRSRTICLRAPSKRFRVCDEVGLLFPASTTVNMSNKLVAPSGNPCSTEHESFA